MSRKDQEFSRLWGELDSCRPLYPDTLRSLEERNSRIPFAVEDESNITRLLQVLERLLEKCEILRSAVIQEFRYPKDS